MKEELNNKELDMLKQVKEAIEQYKYNPTNVELNKLVGGSKKLKKSIHREMKRR